MLSIATLISTYTSNVSASAQCLPEADVYAYKGLLYGQLSRVRIIEYAESSDVASWEDARIVPHIAGLLIKEKLGYTNIEYIQALNLSHMYMLIEEGAADLALTLWPAKYEDTLRAQAISARCPKASNGRCVDFIGRTGYKARSGWYLPANVTAVKAAPQAWSVVNSLFNPGIANLLLRADDLPVTNMCELLDDDGNLIRPDEKYVRRVLPGGSGVYNCSDGSWVLANSTCCPRVEERRGQCNDRALCTYATHP